MFFNHFKIAFRNLLKQKGLSFINIFGLSVGMACFSLFLLYAVHEFSFDQFHTDGDRIYRMYRWTEAMNGDEPEGDPHLPMPLGPALQADYPDVEAVVRWKEAWGESFVKIKGQVSRAEISHVEPNVFQVFSYPLKYGSAETALSNPKNVVLTEATALKLFGESNPTGKTIEIQMEDQFEPFTVAAVAENVSTNSSKQFQIMGSFEYFANTAYGKRRADNWGSSFLSTFVKLREGSGLADNPDELLVFRRKHYPKLEAELRSKGFWTGKGAPVTYKLQPLGEMHLDTQVRGGDVPPVNPTNVWILLAIAAGVLLIAIINFTTLSVGRSAGRAKEIGVRKVIGSSRSALIRQFMVESLMMSFISAAIGLALAQFLLPYFNEMAGRELIFSFSKFPLLGGLLFSATIIAGLMAGSYPALMLSSFRPIEVLKNKVKMGGSNLFTRSLVTTQFTLSSVLIIATLVILSQLEFLRSKHPGFDKENILVVDAEGTDTKKTWPLFRNAAREMPSVIGIAAADMSMGAGTGWSRAGFEYKGQMKETYEYYIDDEYLDVLGMQLVAGRGFEPDRQDGPNRSVVINESMARDFNWSIEEAIGQELTGYFDSEDEVEPKVIGVVKDFHFRPLSEEVEPQMFHQYEDYDPYRFFVRLNEGNPSETLVAMAKQWEAIAPGLPFKYSFLNEDLDRFYREEERYSQIVGWAGGISILLACLGLMGLAALTAVNRTKEIGVRKILGASLTGIVGLLSKDFIKLVLIALLIASPIAWYFMNAWLDNFAYHVQMQWWVFALAGVMAVVVAFLTVGLQGLRAALTNPVDSLRSE